MKYGKQKVINANRIAFIIVLIIASLFFGFFENSKKQDGKPLGNKECDVTVHFIDVGQGDSTFIELPNGKSMLIDAGENEQGVNVVRYIRETGEDYIDYVVATHPHSDHIGGMDNVIKSFGIGTFYMPKCTSTTYTYESMLDALDEQDVTVKEAKEGVVIFEDIDTKIEILSPTEDDYDDLNNFSAVVKLIYKNKSFLFMGDAEKKAENGITADVSSDVIKLGHHGSYTSSGAKFLQRVNPSFAVISCGKGNDYGHPHNEVIKRLNKYDILTFRTDLEGNVVIGTDGENIYY